MGKQKKKRVNLTILNIERSGIESLLQSQNRFTSEILKKINEKLKIFSAIRARITFPFDWEKAQNKNHASYLISYIIFS